MITLRLWKALRNPPESHPLYQRIRMINRAPTSITLQLFSFLLAPFIILPALIVLGAVYGLVWALDVSRHIVREKTQGRYELLQITPDGEFMANWAICTGRAHWFGAFDRANGAGIWVGRILFGTVLMLSFVLSAPFFMTHPDGGVLQIITLVTAGVALVIHHRQSIVLGCLLGMLVPTYVNEEFNARLVAFGLMLLAQIMTYVLSWLLSVVFASLATGYLLWLALSLVGFAAIREALLYGLWRLLIWRLASDPREAVKLLDWELTTLV